MIPTKTLLNFGVFILLVIGPEVCAMMVEYEEPFPPRLPMHVKSRVAFTQYANVPMLSLDEIKRGFPWLEMSAESGADRGGTHRSIESGPRYVFYYVPSEAALHSGGSAEPDPERQNSSKDKTRDHRFKADARRPEKAIEKSQHISKNDKPSEKSVDLRSEPLMGRSRDLVEEERRYERPRDDQEGEQSKSRIRSLPRNRKLRERKFPARSQFLNIAETRAVSSYLYPKVPSPYMQLPKLKFEEKEFWVKNKRKSKRPVEDSATNEERLKNHRIVKQKKSKKIKEKENEKGLSNHRPNYDREHDPEERVESPSGKVERLQKRPKEKPKNPLLLSQDGERVEFQIHGHEGPQTYIFGYDTGDGENRHFRLEERLRDGSVKGHYGYYDSNGKLKMVEYKARPMGGYEEKHHEADAYGSEQKDDDETKS